MGTRFKGLYRIDLTSEKITNAQNEQLKWLDLYAPAVQPFNYMGVLKQTDIGELGQIIKIRYG
ncbi:MAG: hypothetical protein ACI9FJ_000662 [Alteromonadaceae bacterium]